jgi:hypothetical protein
MAKREVLVQAILVIMNCWVLHSKGPKHCREAIYLMRELLGTPFKGSQTMPGNVFVVCVFCLVAGKTPKKIQIDRVNGHGTCFFFEIVICEVKPQ